MRHQSAPLQVVNLAKRERAFSVDTGIVGFVLFLLGVRSLSTSAVPSGSPVLSAITNVRKSSFNESSSLTRSPYAPRADLTSGEEVTVTTIKDDRKERKFVVEADKDHQDDYGNASVKPATAPVAVTPHHGIEIKTPKLYGAR